MKISTKLILLTCVISTGYLIYAFNRQKASSLPPVEELSVVVTDDENITFTTGANLNKESLAIQEGSQQLFKLLKSNKIVQVGFQIIPNKKERTIHIVTSEPKDSNNQKANNWLIQNGYGKIPIDNIVYE